MLWAVNSLRHVSRPAAVWLAPRRSLHLKIELLHVNSGPNRRGIGFSKDTVFSSNRLKTETFRFDKLSFFEVEA